MVDSRHFVKYVGCGNDFILFDNRSGTFPLYPSIFSTLCHRQQGIGADGIILLEESSLADFRMRIFNSDGSEAEMCGNGIRCLMRFLEYLGFENTTYQIQTMKRLLTIEKEGSDVKVNMGELSELRWGLSLDIGNEILCMHYLNTGVPHAVIFVKNLEKVHLKEVGLSIRSHHFFAPHGTNVNFAQLMDQNRICVRTYERGVEDETLACGTGATAVALAAAYQYSLKSPIYIETRFKENLKITFTQDNQNFSDIHLTGPACSTFQGIVNL